MKLCESHVHVKLFARGTERDGRFERPERLGECFCRIAVEPAQPRAMEMHPGQPRAIAERGVDPQRDVDLVAGS